MHHLFTTFLLATDTENVQSSRQTTMMRRSLNSESLRNLRFDDNHDDACQWHSALSSVTCTDGTITAIRLVGYTSIPCLSIHWLPPTTKFLYGRDLVLSGGWTSRVLPRALRHMCLEQCNFGWREKQKNYEIDLRALPENMEELIIDNVCSLADVTAKVVIDHLPQTMRLLLLRAWPVTNLYIGELPPSIEKLAFFYDGIWAPFNISTLDGEVVDWGERVGVMRSGKLPNVRKMSRWYDTHYHW